MDTHTTMLNKTDLLGQLPVKIPQFTLRAFARKDFDLRAHWPDYPFPYTPFNCRWRTLDAAQRDASFTSMMDEDASLILTADDTQHECIAYLGLREIDWATGSAGNLFLRLHPQWCDRGVGTTLMSGLVQWCFAVGLTRLRHDVCALNPRAIRCFEKAGYCITARFWQAGPFFGDNSTGRSRAPASQTARARDGKRPRSSLLLDGSVLRAVTATVCRLNRACHSSIPASTCCPAFSRRSTLWRRP